MKTYIIILDGAADRPIASLDDRTPIEAARTPCLDQLAREGQQGLLTIIRQDICPESDNGAMALLSYDPLEYYTGRGPLEGLGTGFLELSDQAVSFRINFASYNEQEQLLDRRTARDLTEDELQALTQEIKDKVFLTGFNDITFDLVSFRHHRGIFCLRSDTLPLSGNVSNTDPGFRKDGPFGIPVDNFVPRPLKCQPLENSQGAQNVANLVNQFVSRSREVMNNSTINRQRKAQGLLPANTLLLRDGGDPPRAIPGFYEKYQRKLSFYGQMPAEKGLVHLMGGCFTYSNPQAGEEEEDYLRRSVQQITSDPNDVIFIHLKSPDEPGHDGQPLLKLQAIETIDRCFMAPLLQRLAPADLCVVTSDHATPCELGIHSADAVPIILYGRSIVPDATRAFGERYAATGGLPIQRAIDLLPYVLRVENAGQAVMVAE